MSPAARKTATKTTKPAAKKTKKKSIYLVASGDSRLKANQDCWETQRAMEEKLMRTIRSLGFEVIRAHQYKPSVKHGFIASQKEGLEVFRDIPADAPIIVAESVWQYSHHVFPGLYTHQGPILTVANWSGTWPGLVGMLNLNGNLIKAGKPFSTLWSENFDDAWFLKNLETWLDTGIVKHPKRHVTPLAKVNVTTKDRALGKKLADELRSHKAIMGIFDEGCMGMYNAIIQDELLFPLGIFKERLSQSALYYETMQVTDHEADDILAWLQHKGMTFDWGTCEETQLTRHQVNLQCKMYIAAARLYDDFGCNLIGIQYQQGLKDLLPASDLVEGMLNNSDRPPVRSRDGKRIIAEGLPIIHFNEVDEGAGVDALLNNRVAAALEQPLETTLHDVRWGDWDASGTVKDFVWVLMISGAVPPAHLAGGWRGARGYRQSPTYFRLGGSTIGGAGKAGEIVWSRIFVENGKLCMDIGRGKTVALPDDEHRRRADCCTPQWPVVSTVLTDVTRDQFMARHPANHIQIVYAKDAKKADQMLAVKAAMAESLGISVFVCGCEHLKK
ncbi:MAG: fucose isomerase [Thermoguttaceae bacterium]